MVYTFLFLVIIWKWDCVSLKCIWLRTLKYPFIWLLHYEGRARIREYSLSFEASLLKRISKDLDLKWWSSFEVPIYFRAFGNVCWLQLGLSRLWKELYRDIFPLDGEARPLSQRWSFWSFSRELRFEDLNLMSGQGEYFGYRFMPWFCRPLVDTLALWTTKILERHSSQSY